MCPIYTIGSFYVGPEMHMSAQIKKLEVGPIKKKRLEVGSLKILYDRSAPK